MEKQFGYASFTKFGFALSQIDIGCVLLKSVVDEESGNVLPVPLQNIPLVLRENVGEKPVDLWNTRFVVNVHSIIKNSVPSIIETTELPSDRGLLLDE
jgi:hypothetical protein